ncbi:5'-methylthioadenosine/adenosylhomocysteine nucleosidase [Sphaerotilus sp.]|uniref:5'-methylthioadenosine/adenosylhomocysteine nucleosidase n=1 Tax=Sphaerotilus sp. TaxID=2093942 RepID=UPI00286E9521|nr:5'-methylthioadenosine/adenosylhomocysteine nucleosidase [Sphaerotilus sp.]
MTAPRPVAIVSAVAEELAALLAEARGVTVQAHAGRRFHVGTLHGAPVVLVLCGIGKVAAAMTTTLLAERYAPHCLVFTGVAGGLGDGVRVGDVVVAESLLQHDMDASPLFPRFEVPLTGRSRFGADPGLTAALAEAAQALGASAPVLHRGLVISGDRFVSAAAECAALRQVLPDALAVEMEGAALAQVCHDLGLPFAVLRTISDRADDSAHVDFTQFIQVAAQASAAIVGRWLQTTAATDQG